MWQVLKYFILQNLPLLAAFPDQIKTGNNLPGSDPSVTFYMKWHDYLNGEATIFHMVGGWIETPAVKVAYQINHSFEDVFNGMFSLLGWQGNLASSGSPLHPIYLVIQTVGWSLLGLSVIILVLQSLGHNIKWGKILPNVVAVCLTITVLPILMQTAGSTIGGAARQGVSDIRNAKVGGKYGSSMTTSLASQPYKNNIFDVADEVRRNWSDNPNNLNYAKVNHINNDKDVANLDMGQCFDYKGKTATALGLTNKNEGKSHKKAAEVLKYHLVDESAAGEDAGGYTVEKNNEAGLGTLNDYSYSRYKVNWIGLFGQSLLLAAVLIASSIRIGKGAVELTGMELIAPLLAYQSVRSSKKLRDLVNSICGLYMSAVLLLAVIKIFFVFIQTAPTMKPFSGMNNWTKSLAIIIIYVAGAYGLFAGINYFERITGVSQGFTQEGQQAMATGVGAVGLAGAVGAAGGWVAKGGGAVMKHTSGASRNNSFSKAKSALSNNGQSNNKSNTKGINSQLDKDKSKDQTNDHNLSQQNDNSQNKNQPGKNDQFNDAKSQLGGNSNVNDQKQAVNPDGEAHGIGDLGNEQHNNEMPTLNDDQIDNPSTENPVDQAMSEQAPDEPQTDNPVGSEMENTSTSYEGGDQSGNFDSSSDGDHSSTPTPENIQSGSQGIYSAGQKLSSAGNTVHHFGASVSKQSRDYLKNHQFNMSQSGHVHGTDAESFDDE